MSKILLKVSRFFLLAGLMLTSLLLSRAEAPLIRYPTSNRSEVAFVAYDDLWSASLAGGTAHRLMHATGAVSTPMFSPDGRWIAYTLQSGGLHDVFVIPSSGGEERRLTFEGGPHVEDGMVVAWTPDSKRVIFLSRRGVPFTKLVRAFAVPREGGPVELLPLDRAGLMSYAPDGNAIAFNRNFRNLEPRKRYVGGQQQDIYTYRFAAHRLERITSWKGTDTSPMWFGGKLYFLSDRGAGFRQNLWSYSLASRRFHKVTHFTDFDIDWPSLGAQTITFQQGGSLYALDLPSEHLRRVQVTCPDDGERTASRTISAQSAIRVEDAKGGVDYALSPAGDSLLLSAHGEIVRVAAGSAGVDLTNSPEADEDHPSWSPDGKMIVYETDANGEQQLAMRPVAGGREQMLTHFTQGYFYTPVWSPLGNSLAVADANHSLWWIHLDGQEPQQIATDPYAEIRDAAFSPDGRWLAYSTQRATQLRAIHLHELVTGKDVIVSSPMESDRMPVFTADGRGLVFVSQRHEQLFVSDRDDENIIATINSDGLYMATLQAPKSQKEREPGAGSIAEQHPVTIDLDGLMARAVELPVTSAVLDTLQIRGPEVFYLARPPQGIRGDLEGFKSALHCLDLRTDKDRVVLQGLDSFSLSEDGRSVAFRTDGVWKITRTADHAGAIAVTLDLSSLRVRNDPRREWAEMFENAWRLDRDVFFSRVMNGSDWQAVHDAYAKFIPSLGSQDDFLYLLRQLQGEIASSHTFLKAGADPDGKPSVSTVLLGADYQLDRASGRYQFAAIFTEDPTRAEYAGPLGIPSANVTSGDYLLAINGIELAAPNTPDHLLQGVSGDVTLTVASTPSSARRTITVHPVRDDAAVRRHDWIEGRRRFVQQISGGRLGYVFLTDFGSSGPGDFVRQFYPQIDKAGLIFDVRWNTGGFTSQAVLDVLRRERAGVFVNREGAVSPLPAATAPKVLVALTNVSSASDGDQFPYFFRKFGLGKVVGEQTWGGVQGINAGWVLMDGTSITIPKDALASVDGHWVIENQGATPDVEVAAGVDESLYNAADDMQLRAAVKVALKQLRKNPPRSLKAPPELPAYPARGNVPGYNAGSASVPNRRSE